MEKSTTKFLAVLLSLALLFSFPIAANANNATYEETFTGTYTAPSAARNVLVSGDDALISEWYGDRVNFAKNTYSVRQNQYGLNKDGNMIDASTDTTYTLWLAQYGVASIRFQAPEDGDYQFYTKQNTRFPEHSASFACICAYKYVEVEENDFRYRRFARSYAYYYEDEEMQDACAKLNLEKDEVIFITVEANKNKDSIVDFEIAPWSDETCHHDWEWDDEDDYGLEAAKCVREQAEYCRLCEATRTVEVSDHNYEEAITPLGNDRFRYEWKCTKCDDISDSWEHSHNFKTVVTEQGCETRYEYTCTECNRVDEYESWVDTDCHDWEYFETKGANCVVTYGQKCVKCGKINEYNGGTYTDHTWPAQPDYTRNGCQITCVYHCADCGAVVWTYEYDSHTNVDWDAGVEDKAHCKTTYYCNDCNQYFDEYDHGDTYYDYETRGCITYYQEICKDCGAIIDEDVDETNHETDVTSTYNKKTHMYHYVETCKNCQEIIDEWDSEDDWDTTPDGRKYYYGDCEKKYEAATPGSQCQRATWTYTCTDGSKYVESWISHEGGDWEYVQISPQHDNVCGVYNFVCSDCGLKKYEKDLICHSNNSEWETECKLTSTCARCGKKESEMMHSRAHSFDMKTTNATCGKDGERYYYCDDCGEKVVTEIIKATGKHNYKTTVTRQPTFTSYGIMTYKCAGCGASYTRSIAKLVKPVLKSVKKSSARKFKATWKASAGVDGYQVQYSTTKKFKSKVGKTKYILKSAKVKGAKKSSFTTPKLKNKGTYYVRVRAYRKIGKKTYYSGWSKTSLIKIK